MNGFHLRRPPFDRLRANGFVAIPKLPQRPVGDVILVSIATRASTSKRKTDAIPVEMVVNETVAREHVEVLASDVDANNDVLPFAEDWEDSVLLIQTMRDDVRVVAKSLNKWAVAHFANSR